MSRTERQKGLRGEREVAAIYRRHGLQVRGLEGGGDHLVVCPSERMPSFHSEVKRQETARVWAWFEQARTEAPAHAVPVVAFRRNNSPWLAVIELERLAELLHFAMLAAEAADAEWTIDHGSGQ